MRKQTKLAVVLAAAALVAVGSASLVSAAGWVQEGSEWRYQDASGDYVTDTMKKSGDTTFFLDENGYMAKDYFTQYNENYYYFGSNGAMVRNTWVAIDPSLVDNADEDVDAYWFYFQDTGKAFKSGDGDIKKKKIDGKTYFFDSDGKMLTGWFDNTGEKKNTEDETDFVDGSTETMYYAGEDGVARSGWLAWSNGFADSVTVGNSDVSDRTTVYFYFNTTNFKMTKDKEKTINGKKYRFDNSGIMYTGWEYDETETTLGYDQYKYYSGEDDGHMVKKGWVYAVPSEIIDSEKNYDDDSQYFYFNTNGMMQTNSQKRINGKYYIFAKNGIMKTGLIILNRSNEYVGKIDLEYTDGADFIKRNYFQTDDPAKYPAVGDRGNVGNAIFGEANHNALHVTPYYTIHYFGSDGAKVTGNKISIEFADDIYTFASKNSGGFVGEKKKKFYSNGFLLSASDDIKLGLVMANEGTARLNVQAVSGSNFPGFDTATKQMDFWSTAYADIDLELSTGTPDSGQAAMQAHADGDAKYVPSNDVDVTDPNACYVVTTAGAQKKKGAYKDADGNYWLVNDNKICVGIYDVQVKYVANKKPQWKGNIPANYWWLQSGIPKLSGKDGKDDVYIDFDCKDKLQQTQRDHLVAINNDYCLNFTIDDSHYGTNYPGNY